MKKQNKILIFVLFQFIILCSLLRESNSISKAKPENNDSPKKEIGDDEDIEPITSYKNMNDDTALPRNTIYTIGDGTFDSVIRNGKKYKWFILFYVPGCGHCKRARKEINQVVGQIEQENVRFAQVDTESQMMSAIRFNVTKIPYIVLIYKNQMYELNKYPSAKNLLEFINTNFTEVKNELLPVPKRIKFFYVGWIIMKEFLQSVKNFANYKTGLNLEGYHYVIIFFVLLTLFCYIEYKLIGMCCNDDIDNELFNKLKEQTEDKDEDVDEAIEEELEKAEAEDEKAQIEKLLREKEKEKIKEAKEKKKDDKEKNENKDDKKKVPKKESKKKKKEIDLNKKND